MKLYTDYTGKFQMYMPIDWQYRNPIIYEDKNNVPQAFAKYDNKSSSAFQISCKEVTPHIANLISTRNEKTHSSNDELQFTKQRMEVGNQITYAFSCAVDDHYLFATYIYSKEEDGTPFQIDELTEVERMLSSIKFIKPEYRKIVQDNRRFDLFMSSMASIIDLKNKAIKNGSFIEVVALSANHIDALLRLAIVLKKQLDTASNNIDISYLFQNEEDKPVMERAIYRQTLDEEIITQDIFDKLEELYRERNKVIHRFAITDIRTDHILKLSIQYSELEEKLGAIVNRIEKEQAEKGIGVHANNTTLDEKPMDTSLDKLIASIRDKHGNIPIDNILGVNL